MIDLSATRFFWYKPSPMIAKKYTCGYCGNKVSSEKGMQVGTSTDGSGSITGSGMYICPHCKGGSFFYPNNLQIPGHSVGNQVKDVPLDINTLYEEARNCYSNNNYNASIFICRKLLMNISVNQGAKEGLNFLEYVNYLSNNGFIPPNGKHWVDHIRKKGNEANHEIILMNEKDAFELIIFIEMLLKFIYEFPNMVPVP